MKHLPLFSNRSLAIEGCDSKLSSKEICRRCPVYVADPDYVETLPDFDESSDEESDVVLVVGGYNYRPLAKDLGAYIKSKHGDLSYNVQRAIRCSVGTRKGLARGAAVHCGAHTLKVIHRVSPKRVILLGRDASYHTFDEVVDLVRKSYGFLSDGTPVFPIAIPFGDKTRFHKDEIKEDLSWALTAKVGEEFDMATAARVCVVQTRKESEAIADELIATSPGISYDVETFGRQYKRNYRLVSAAVHSIDSMDVYVWHPVRYPETSDALFKLLGSDITKIGANIKYDIKSVECLGHRVGGAFVDIQHIASLEDVNQPIALAKQAGRVGMLGIKDEGALAVKKACSMLSKYRTSYGRKQEKASYDTPLFREMKRAVESCDLMKAAVLASEHTKAYAYGLIPPDTLYVYNARDAYTTSRIYAYLVQNVSDRTKFVFNELIGSATRAFSNIERKGILVDKNALDLFVTQIEAKMEESMGVIKSLVGEYLPDDFNPNSNAQLRKLLYKDLKLPCDVKTDTGENSVNQEALTNIEAMHDVIPAIQQYNTLSKLQNTYGRGLSEHICEDGRIRCTFNLVGAATGRLSCKSPNLQTIPSRGQYAKAIKNVFIAAPTHSIVQFDYSQIELRVVASESQDERMCEIYRQGIDYHGEVAKIISPSAFGVEWQKPSQEDFECRPDWAKHMTDIRSIAKTCVFGLIYGMGDKTLAHNTRTTERQASSIRRDVLGSFVGLARWIDEMVAFTRRNGYTHTTWKGRIARKRKLYDILSKDSAVSAHAKNAAYNTPVQGKASDYCLASNIEVERRLRKYGDEAGIILSVHDSIVLEVADTLLEEVINTVKAVMESWELPGVPLVSDCEYGKSWGNLKEVNFVDGKCAL